MRVRGEHVPLAYSSVSALGTSAKCQATCQRGMRHVVTRPRPAIGTIEGTISQA